MAKEAKEQDKLQKLITKVWEVWGAEANGAL